MIGALAAARAGARVTLVERNEKLGKKLYITGKGRCNVTNACEPDAFQKNVVKNPRFLYSALRAFSPREMMELLESLGCPVKVERGDRVFPVSDKASDVTRALENELRRLGVSIRLNTRVRELLLEDGRVAGVRTEDGQTLRADSVILCTGGASYQSTGSTGDGYGLLAQCGHQVFPALPALVGLCCEEEWVTELQGLTLKNVRLTLRHGKKTLYTEIGEMLFTHFGVSGPLALSASSYMAELDARECVLTLDLKPGLSEQQLDARVMRDVGTAGRKELRTLLCGLYPARLAETMERLCQLDGRKQANLLTREERGTLVQTTKALTLPVTALRPLAEAVVTRGGLDVRQVSPSTMESKLVPGLYVSGELLDVDALTGGFNLHIAFATGFAAGRAAAQGRAMNE